MTPPQGDWDREVEPGSPEEIALRFQNSEGLTQFFKQIGRGVNAYVDAIQKAFTPVLEAFENVSKQVGPVLLQIEKLDQDELVKNGRHVVKSQKPGITLPARITNSGPPEGRKRN
jgi:hypothetical protein